MTGTRSAARARFHFAQQILLVVGAAFAGAGAWVLLAPLEHTGFAASYTAWRDGAFAVWGVGWIAFSVLPLLFAASSHRLRRDPGIVRSVASSLVPVVQLVAIPSFWSEASLRLGMKARALAQPATSLCALSTLALVSAPVTYLLDERYTWGAFRLHFGVLAVALGFLAVRFAGRMRAATTHAAALEQS
jgi:hypothetical protein